MQVYKLREQGAKLPHEVVLERGPVCGELRFRERLSRSGIYLATLCITASGKYGLRPLDRAHMHRMTPNGLMIAGREIHTRSESIKSSFTTYPQVWWCVPLGLPPSPLLDPGIEPEKAAPAWQRAISQARPT